MIEDILPVFNTQVKLAVDAPVKAVTLAPQMTDLDFEQKDGHVKYTVPEFECHQMVVIQISED